MPNPFEEILPAFPQIIELEKGATYTALGLTKREYFAAKAMQGFILRDEMNIADLVKLSAVAADALIEELEKDG